MEIPRMKVKLLSATAPLFALLVSTPYAVAPSPESELIALNDAWIHAEVHHDKAALERLLDERFLVISSSGQTLNRAAFIDRIMSKETQPFEVVNVHGDAALVISTTMDRTIKFTWVAVKKEVHQWLIVRSGHSGVEE